MLCREDVARQRPASWLVVEQGGYLSIPHSHRHTSRSCSEDLFTCYCSDSAVVQNSVVSGVGSPPPLEQIKTDPGEADWKTFTRYCK